jgi:selenium metabolism protein YedF
MKNTIIISSQWLGQGNDALGQNLMRNYLRKLWSEAEKVKEIIFYNSAVLLLTKEMNTAEALSGLEDSGVDLVACGTCVEHFGIQEKMVSGRISDMQEIANLMLGAEKVITV